MLKNAGVKARIAELDAETERVYVAHAAIDRDFVLQGLKTIAVNGHEPAASRVRSFELLGKELGMFRERVDHFDWDGDIKKLDTPTLEKFIHYFEELAAQLPLEELPADQKQVEAGPVVDVTAEPVKEPKS